MSKHKENHNKQVIFGSSDNIKEQEFKTFMKAKAKEQIQENISCIHCGYDSTIIGTREYMYEILKDKKWGTEMYYLKEIKDI